MSFFTNDQISALAAREVRAAWLAQLEFKSATERVWAGHTTLDANGYEWKPTYGAVQIDGLGWRGESASRPITFRLSALDTSLLQLARAGTDEADQQPVSVYFQFFDSDWQPTGSPVPVFLGLMQPPQVSRGEIEGAEGAEHSISLTAENLFYNRSRPPNGRYTTADQAHRAGTSDDFLNFIPLLLHRTFRWPVF